MNITTRTSSMLAVMASPAAVKPQLSQAAYAAAPAAQVRDNRLPLVGHLDDKTRLAEMIRPNRGGMVALPLGMIDIGMVKGIFRKQGQVNDLQRADKLVDEAMGLAWDGDPVHMMQAQQKMEEASKIRQAVAKQLSPELQQRILFADSLEKSAVGQVIGGYWNDDPAMASAGITDYKAGREQFQLIEDDILGRPHGGPSL